MSVDSRSPIRALRRPKKEQERPDYSEPDFGSWAAKLDQFIPASESSHASVQTESAASAAPAAAAAVSETPAPAAVAKDRSNLDEVLDRLMGFDGAMSVALVDSETGMILGKAGSGGAIDLAAAGASVILRARLASSKALGSTEKIDDLLISLTSQIQIIHPLPSNPSIFTFLIGDKSKSSLAMARYKATEADQQIRL
jgi:hypothetical protein